MLKNGDHLNNTLNVRHRVKKQPQNMVTHRVKRYINLKHTQSNDNMEI